MLEEVVRQQPGFIAAHVLLARLYSKLNRTADYERERAEIERLQALEQTLYHERQKNLQNQPAPQPQPSQPATPPER